MKYQIINNSAKPDVGGHYLVSAIQVYLVDENRTVYVICSDTHAEMTTVDYLHACIADDDFDRIVIEWADFGTDNSIDLMTYFDIFQHCMLLHAKNTYEACRRRLLINYCWVPEEVRLQMDKEDVNYMATWGFAYETDGGHIYTTNADDGGHSYKIIDEYDSEKTTMRACLVMLTDYFDRYGKDLPEGLLPKLQRTIAHAYHYSK